MSPSILAKAGSDKPRISLLGSKPICSEKYASKWKKIGREGQMLLCPHNGPFTPSVNAVMMLVIQLPLRTIASL